MKQITINRMRRLDRVRREIKDSCPALYQLYFHTQINNKIKSHGIEPTNR